MAFKMFDKNGDGIITNRTVVLKSFKWSMSLYKELLKGTPSKKDGIKGELGTATQTWHLPLPNVINDNSSVGWEGFGLTGAAQGMADKAGAAGAGMTDKNGNSTGVAKATGKIAALVKGMSGVATKIASVQGEAVNPNSYLTFRENEPRSISLMFSFMPKNEEEANIITEGIIAIKNAMSPGFGRIFLSSPDIFSLTFGEDSSFLNNNINFSACVLTSAKVSYGVDGSMAMFITEDGLTPKMSTLSLTFSEYAPKDKSDWGDK